MSVHHFVFLCLQLRVFNLFKNTCVGIYSFLIEFSHCLHKSKEKNIKVLHVHEKLTGNTNHSERQTLA